VVSRRPLDLELSEGRQTDKTSASFLATRQNIASTSKAEHSISAALSGLATEPLGGLPRTAAGSGAIRQ
jgi:hypothetical protein